MRKIIDAVIKLGGSVLQDHFDSVQPLLDMLTSLGKHNRLVVVPGGGTFADEARRLSKDYRLSESTAHWMAILAMDQMAFIANQLISGSHIVFDVSDAKRITKGHQIAILAPFRLMRNRDVLPHSWNITSDSIAAYIAKSVQSAKLVLIKDVDGIFTNDPKKTSNALLIEKTTASELIEKMNQPTCVDKMFPRLIRGSKLNVHIVNGLFPDRIEKILKGERTTETVVMTI